MADSIPGNAINEMELGPACRCLGTQITDLQVVERELGSLQERQDQCIAGQTIHRNNIALLRIRVKELLNESP